MTKYYWIAMALMGSMVWLPAHAEGPVCGDVDQDGITNVVDALRIARGEPLLCAAPGLLAVTGQDEPLVKGDDGDTRAGLPLSFVDNHDGTITDLNTGLMWEKKVAGEGVAQAANLHDADNSYPWSGLCSISSPPLRCGTDADCPETETCDAPDGQTASPNGLTIFEWVEELNAVAFAGHTDWRVPNYRELTSLLKLERVILPDSLSVDFAFLGVNCRGDCTDLADPQCSCTSDSEHWSSTTFMEWFSRVEYARVVEFRHGLSEILQMVPTNFAKVRAVRGGP
ncbi:MAG: Lcl C-terminal domain-containing protein [Planctomycetota bacterium]|jgi:hypothetical protein